MTRTPVRRWLAAIPSALAMLVAGLVAGCAAGDQDAGGGGRGGDPVASANGGSDRQQDGGGSGKPPSEDEVYDQLLGYAQCLRDHGMDVADPAPGEGIQIQNEGGPNSNDQALEACEDKAPAAPVGAPDEEEERAEMLEFAACMRENGVEKFQDPKPGEGIHLDPELEADPDFVKADEKCQQLFGGTRDSTESSSR